MQVMTEKCVGVERSRPTKGRSLVSNDCTEQEAAGRSGPIGPATTAGADAGDGGQPPIGVRARETRHAKLAPVSETYRARLALTAWLTAAAVGCGIPLEPAAPENIELKVEPDHVTIAWEKPPSWLQLRRYEWRALTGGAADKRLACPEAGDEDFCYLRPMRDPRIELPRPAGAHGRVQPAALQHHTTGQRRIEVAPDHSPMALHSRNRSPWCLANPNVSGTFRQE